jgi:hypothetical protein
MVDHVRPGTEGADGVVAIADDLRANEPQRGGLGPAQFDPGPRGHAVRGRGILGMDRDCRIVLLDFNPRPPCQTYAVSDVVVPAAKERSTAWSKA